MAGARKVTWSQKQANKAKKNAGDAGRYFKTLWNIHNGKKASFYIDGKEVPTLVNTWKHRRIVRDLLINDPNENERTTQEIYIQEGSAADDRRRYVDKQVTQYLVKNPEMTEAQIEELTKSLFQYYVKNNLFININVLEIERSFQLHLEEKRKECTENQKESLAKENDAHTKEIEEINGNNKILNAERLQLIAKRKSFEDKQDNEVLSIEDPLEEQIKNKESAISVNVKRKLHLEQCINENNKVVNYNEDEEKQKFETSKKNQLIAQNQKDIRTAIKHYVIGRHLWNYLDNSLKQGGKLAVLYDNLKKADPGLAYAVALKELTNTILADAHAEFFQAVHHFQADHVLRQYLRQRIDWEKEHPKKPFVPPYVCPLTQYAKKAYIHSTSHAKTPQNSKASTPRDHKDAVQEIQLSPRSTLPAVVLSGTHREEAMSPRLLGADFKDPQRLASPSHSPRESYSQTKSEKNYTVKKPLPMPTWDKVVTKNPLKWVDAGVQAVAEGAMTLTANQSVGAKIVTVPLVLIPVGAVAVTSKLSTKTLSFLCRNGKKLVLGGAESVADCATRSSASSAVPENANITPVSQTPRNQPIAYSAENGADPRSKESSRVVSQSMALPGGVDDSEQLPPIKKVGHRPHVPSIMFWDGHAQKNLTSTVMSAGSSLQLVIKPAG